MQSKDDALLYDMSMKEIEDLLAKKILENFNGPVHYRVPDIATKIKTLRELHNTIVYFELINGTQELTP
jgi:hypothetical protein